MKKLTLITILFGSLSLLSAEREAPFSLSVGTQTIGVRYKFTDEPALVETAREIQSLGSDTLKIAVTPKYTDDYLMEPDPSIKSVHDLVRTKAAYEQVMDMPFRNIMLWLYPFSDEKSAFFDGKIPEKEAKAIYDEIYEFTAYILRRYSGSGKSFFIGNWEGDWHVLKEIFNYELDPEPESIEGAISWFKLREKAVSDARRETPHEDVSLYYYIELNHVKKAMEDDRPTIVNEILPHIKTDFVSWSSYDTTVEAAKVGGEEGRQMVLDTLDYIESHLPESDIPGKRVFIGEYGFKLSAVKDVALQQKYTASIIKWGLEWGCPFILYWELYCNEIEEKTGEHRGFWLIDDHGDKQPVWFFHKAFLRKANHFLETFESKHGKLPTQEEYLQRAASWVHEFETYRVE